MGDGSGEIENTAAALFGESEKVGPELSLAIGRILEAFSDRRLELFELELAACDFATQFDPSLDGLVERFDFFRGSFFRHAPLSELIGLTQSDLVNKKPWTVV